MSSQENQLAPVVVFAYNRPDHIDRALQSLTRARLAGLTDVYVYIDGPRTPAGQQQTASVQQVVESYGNAFRSLDIRLRERNFGLAANIISGVTEVIGMHGAAIVVEDDLIVAPGFIEYMNWGLRAFANEPAVGSIHGYCYPDVNIPDQHFFLRGADCWGWATWSDRWKLLELNGRTLLSKIIGEGLLWEFTLGFCAPYCRMLCRQILRKNDSWAIRWHASLFLANRLTLYPTQSLVQNAGLDGSGQHCEASNRFATTVTTQDFSPPASNPSINVSIHAESAFQKVLLHSTGNNLNPLKRLANAILDLSFICRVFVSR